MEFVILTGENLLVLVQLALLPVIAGFIASLVVWKGKIGRLRLQRILINDTESGRPAWKLVARSVGKPVNRCRLRVDGKDLSWEGINDPELDIGPDGVGMALVPIRVQHDTRVSARSGSFPVFRGKFGSLDEVCVSK